MLKYKTRIGKTYIYFSALISVVIFILIVGVISVNSWDAISTQGWHLFTTKWHPPTNNYGILPMLYGTFTVTFLALIIAVPLGLLTAIYTSEFLPKKFRFIVKSLLELLAGIPSIVYGLIGIAFFSGWIQSAFDLATGRTLLAAGILLAIMVIPTIITLTDDALQAVPFKYKEAATGLGFYRFEVIKEVLLPLAKSDIVGAILLALGRALGETMAVMLVIGGIDKMPSPFYNILSSGQTITSKLGREIAETSFGSVHFSVLLFMGLILLVIVLVFTIIAQNQFKQNDRLYE